MAVERLKYRGIWLAVGYLMLAAVIYVSLMAKLPRGGIFYSDKITHIVSYGVLMWWFAQLYPKSRRLLLAALFVAMGVALEFGQAQVSRYRILDTADMLANSAGIIVGWVLVKTPLPLTIHRIEQWLPTGD